MKLRNRKRSVILPALSTLPNYPIIVPRDWYGENEQEEQQKSDEFLERFADASKLLSDEERGRIDYQIDRQANFLRIFDAETRDFARDRLLMYVSTKPFPADPVLKKWAWFKLHDALRHKKLETQRELQAREIYCDRLQWQVNVADSIDELMILGRLLTLAPLETDDRRKAAVLRACPLSQDEQAALLGVSRATVIRWKADDKRNVLETGRILLTLPTWLVLDLFVYEGQDKLQISVELGLSTKVVAEKLRQAKKLIHDIIKGDRSWTIA